MWQWAGNTYRPSKTHPLGLMLQVCQVLWDHGQGDFFLVLLPSSFSSQHVPKSQPVPPQTSPDLEHLPGEGTSWGTEEQVSNRPFLQGFPFILLALP